MPNQSLVNTCPVSVLQLGSLEQQKLWVEEQLKAVHQSKQNSISLPRFEKSDQELDLGGPLVSMVLSLPAARMKCGIGEGLGSCGISMLLQAQSWKRE